MKVFFLIKMIYRSLLLKSSSAFQQKNLFSAHYTVSSLDVKFFNLKQKINRKIEVQMNTLLEEGQITPSSLPTRSYPRKSQNSGQAARETRSLQVQRTPTLTLATKRILGMLLVDYGSWFYLFRLLHRNISMLPKFPHEIRETPGPRQLPGPLFRLFSTATRITRCSPARVTGIQRTVEFHGLLQVVKAFVADIEER